MVNGLASNRQQVITWSNDAHIYRGIHACLKSSEKSGYRMMMITKQHKAYDLYVQLFARIIDCKVIMATKTQLYRDIYKELKKMMVQLETSPRKIMTTREILEYQ